MQPRQKDHDPDYGLDALIARVAAKADISEEAATRAVDIVLTAVKARLPQPMAKRLVPVIAGEASFDNPVKRALAETRRRATETRCRWEAAWARSAAAAQKFIDSVTRMFKAW